MFDGKAYISKKKKNILFENKVNFMAIFYNISGLEHLS